MGHAWRGASLLLIAAHDVFIYYGDNGNGKRGNGVTAMINRSIATAIAVAMALGQWQLGKRTGATAITMALGHRSRGNRPVLQWQWQWGNDQSYCVVVCCIAAQNVDNSG
jgi:hypothetical protein